MGAEPGGNHPVNCQAAPRVAEFFAGVGLVRMALEQEGCHIVFANDIDCAKRHIYAANFDASCFHLCDVREISGGSVPDVDLATASFPCTDLSLAGNRAGLDGAESSILWEFLRVLGEMGHRKPKAILLENVVGFATSSNGNDLRAAIAALNGLGYACDILSLDARSFIPQSRPRLFIVGATTGLPDAWASSETHPDWAGRFVQSHPDLAIHALRLPPLPTTDATLAGVVERMEPIKDLWWDVSRLGLFLASLSPIQAERLESLRRSKRLAWATAYRRTRRGVPVWEIRPDSISGCLRTGSGGSSKQALVEAGNGNVRVRWMTAREYARLQGAPGLQFGEATERQARFALGDAVCVPVVAWLARHYLVPLVRPPVTEGVTTYA